MAALGISGLPAFEYVGYTAATKTAYILSSNTLNNINNTNNNTELRFQPNTYIFDFIPYNSLKIVEQQRPIFIQKIPQIKLTDNDFSNSDFNQTIQTQIQNSSQSTAYSGNEKEKIAEFKLYFNTFSANDVFNNEKLNLLPKIQREAAIAIIEGNADPKDKYTLLRKIVDKL